MSTTQKSSTINSFNIGDIITRIEPAIWKSYENQKIEDDSYIGAPLKYNGSINGIIYLEHTKNYLCYNKGDITELELHRYSNGWAKYIDPKSLERPVMDVLMEEYNKNIKLN
jgi:hypothetical protein